MCRNLFSQHLSRPWRVLGSWVILTGMLLILAACETVFPARPEAHRLLQEMHNWPEPYYWLVATGVASRVMALRTPGASVQDAIKDTAAMLRRVKEQWQRIDALETAEALIAYCQRHELMPIAAAIQQTLTANQAHAPTSALHQQLQATAIKRGLLNAYWEVQRELSS